MGENFSLNNYVAEKAGNLYSIHMSMSKRVQIPISDSEEQLLKTAAKRQGLSLAEWARGHLKAKAQESLGAQKISPLEAIKVLSELNAPIDSVEVMKEQSLKGRYK